ncbi:MAG: PQQ-dependent sugar dehydrogenase [Anaerolineae bacterium]|nr:PQQ-dependent sugar dehydrogenase [Anaerolineae bacterium]
MVIPAAAQEEGEASAVSVQLVAEGLSAPVAMATPNDGSGRLFVVDQAGMIRIIMPDVGLMPDPFLDLTGLIIPLRTDYDERGVLGLAFHPDYANNGRFFVYYTAPLRAEGPAGWDHTNVVAEFAVSADNPDMGDLASQKTVLQIDQPQFNHNAGHIAFGPDGYLYIPIGDGGGADDTAEGHTPNLGNGQDLSNLHGSILRIDVNGNPGEYAIPADNPFANQEGVAPEIYAYGLRNPFDISFDTGGNGELFAADAGQNLYEEVSIVTAGGNYGWNIKEGTHCFDPANADVPLESCPTTGANGEALVDPVIEYSHDDVGVVVVGGHVYRGSALPDLAGYYIFGDYTSGDSPNGTLLWAEPGADGGMWTWGELMVAGMPNNRIGANVLAVGKDEAGELYVLTSNTSAPSGDTGKVWKIVPATGEVAEPAAGGSEPATTEEPSG